MIKFPREQRSLFGEILDWMLAPLLVVWPMSVALTWVVAQGIAGQPFDKDLSLRAQTLATRVVEINQASRTRARAPHSPSMRLNMRADELDILSADDTDEFFFQVLGQRGEFVAGLRSFPLPEVSVGEAGSVKLRDDEIQGQSVRVAAVWLPAEPGEPSMALVQVAETLGKRSMLAADIIKGVILPQFLILPLAVILVWFALARGMAPLNDLQQRIRRRESQDLSPLDEHDVPEEVSPLVGSINDLLARLNVSIGTQKHFLADAAHQLKTPLAGLRTQAELAHRAIDAGDLASARQSMQYIARSSQRAAHMVNQLLSLARADVQGQALRMQPINLLALAESTVTDFFVRARDQGIDLGLEGGEPDSPAQPVWIQGDPVLVRELMRNLVDNALHYTPEGGRVTVRVVHDPFGQVAVLIVEDDGIGIPEAERERVFQAFYRPLDNLTEGSGLGLAIVKEVAERHGATVCVDATRPSARERPGARFTVRFAAATLAQTGGVVSAQSPSA